MAKRPRKQKPGGAPPAPPQASAGSGDKRRREVVDTVTRLAEPLCRAGGLELVHVEYQREPGGLTLRIYLDQPGGITLDDCVDMSRKLGDVLDVHDADWPPYQLEVSSPGIERPLGKLSDFERFTGRRAKIRMMTAVGGQKNFTGTLVGVVDKTIRLQVGEAVMDLNSENIARARLVDETNTVVPGGHVG
ncbi:ribosome maturation factor RimP [Desulfosarcina sp. OttesenSCG-928-G10]|nr:ribosome maturation factor RimP [Desulfosarcina sp. OttesenSCG-928-G10]